MKLFKKAEIKKNVFPNIIIIYTIFILKKLVFFILNLNKKYIKIWWI
jgi:hypothetical protein